MLKLTDIVKHYQVGNMTVEALRGITVAFRRSEFVAVLGPSGCGKTTLLNIIGGLDRYTSGDLSINGRSTKHFKDRDWDTYRNHSVGFVFQNYNLIPHQTVLANVELALTLTGVRKAERRRRAIEVLTRVGLADQIHKKPNQLSGGQMQRVAIARALINDPEILLADEPTGALDSETSVQVMDILKEVAKDRLVIMVTHNAALAEKYATRIIRLQDGRIISDSNPYDGSDATPAAAAEAGKLRRPSMSFWTALSLSLNNLLTKKTRTILTAFAGSIGIIGIALILSLSSGFHGYIKDVEAETLTVYPISLESQTVDLDPMTFARERRRQLRTAAAEAADAVYVNTRMTDMMNLSAARQRKNDLAAFKAYLEAHREELDGLVAAVAYQYDVKMTVYAERENGDVIQVHPSTVLASLGLDAMMELNPNASAMMSLSGLEVWREIIDNPEYLEAHYDLLAGRWPESYDELVLIVNDRNEISDVVLYSLGLADPKELPEVMAKLREGITVEPPRTRYSFDEILGLRFKLVLNTDLFVYDEAAGVWVDKRGDEEHLRRVLEGAPELRIAGIVRPSGTTLQRSVSGTVGYTPALTQYVVEATLAAPIVQQQLASPDTNVFTGLPFGSASAAPSGTRLSGSSALAPSGAAGALSGPGSFGAPSATGLAEAPEAQSGTSSGLPQNGSGPRAYLSTLSSEELAALAARLGQPAPAAQVPADSYDEVLALLGVVDLARPSRINIYAVDFEAREKIADFIAEYNRLRSEAGEEAYVIHYSDIVQTMMSSVTSIINSISYVLIAFVAISLVVSSIMIGIITYVSVLERTKEIGILRSIGASKRDIARVFNAETLIVGFTAGAMGILLTVLLCIPINRIIEAVSDIPGVAALPAGAAVVLIAISMTLTLIAGLIPSRIAANKDPVVALRTE